MDNQPAPSTTESPKNMINNPLINPNISDDEANVETYSVSIIPIAIRHWTLQSTALKIR